MKAELYFVSPTEEYANKHVCRKHWSYQWRRSRSSYLENPAPPKIRKESFGGLIRLSNGELWKLDPEAYFYLNMILN